MNKKIILIIVAGLVVIVALCVWWEICRQQPIDTQQSIGTYYDWLEKKCEEKENESCCKASADAMKQGQYELAKDGVCPEGYNRNMMLCISSYQWCEPAKKDKECALEGEHAGGSCVGCIQECCLGLKIMARKKINGECTEIIPPPGGGVCSNCGNGVCDAQNEENECNCPEDCSTEPDLDHNTEQTKCTNAGGTWKKFGNGCVDSCVYARNPTTIFCTEALADGCDCGPDKCWNGSGCENN